ncbi:hypothetical protein QBC33DRAFT_557848 [Phialemonium atrogriseum]|uniref:Major facilitator superfamily (MFS) profile domain-containing protein n=1 Tax=Phialemonium atrogriseum TaxID=1093897 RepID=A0AAJ0FML4_9PEZI|nr:uncharacterized protein QBC33DRAFT_557848 [Phialemonium atrogriseum]KAK1768388.1 hypothetical protein QBC33DRAFT_557848 [Phialemonium atrogriseum]
MGFLGILEDTKLPHVPGTVILNEEAAQSENLTSGLKQGTRKDTKKFINIFIIRLGAILNAATMGPLLAGMFDISQEFNVPIGNITLISGYQLLLVATSGPIVSACSRKWGKRLCFIISTAFAILELHLPASTKSAAIRTTSIKTTSIRTTYIKPPSSGPHQRGAHLQTHRSDTGRRHQGHVHQGHVHQGHVHQGHAHQGHAHQDHFHQGCLIEAS